FEKFGWDKTVDQLFSIQSKKLEWQHFSINALRENDIGRQLLHAMEKNCQAMIVYGTNPNSEKFRPIRPKGIVRNPDGDFVYALCELDNVDKRFYLRRIQKAKLVEQLELF